MVAKTPVGRYRIATEILDDHEEHSCLQREPAAGWCVALHDDLLPAAPEGVSEQAS